MAAIPASRLPYCTANTLRSLGNASSPLRPAQWHARAQPRKTFPARTFASSCRLQERKYTRDHEWIDLEPNGKTGTIGISSYAARNLGDVVYVELPTHSLQCSKGDAIGAVESVKSASDIMTPVSGTIVGVNEALQESPGLINKDPEGEGGWIARIEVAELGRKEFDTPDKEAKQGEAEDEGPSGLMDETAYGQFTAE